MLVRLIFSGVKRARDVRCSVGIAHGQIDHGKAELVVQLAHQTNGFCQIGRQPGPLAHAEAIRPCVAVVNSKARCDHKIVCFIDLCRADRIFEQARPVLIAAAIYARACKGRRQFCQQIPMTGFDIHCVKSSLARKKRGLAEFFLQRLEIVVRHDAAVVRRAVLLQFRMAVGNDRSRLVVRV